MRDLFSPYLDGRLDPVKRDRMLYHIEICPACREELSTLEETVKLLRSIPAAFPARSFTSDVWPRRSAFFGKYRLREAGLRIATAAAAMVLFASLAIGFTGVFDESSPAQGITADNHQKPMTDLSSPAAETPVGEITPTSPSSTEGGDIAPPEATQPNTSPGLFIGSDQTGAIQKSTETGESAPPEATQHTPELISGSPSWIRWMQIVGGAMVAVLISINIVAWRRRR